MPTSPQSPRKQLDYKNLARLSTLPATGYSSDDAEGKITIYLPHLPEDLELPRENTYNTGEANPVMPDGLFVYQSTSPLEINFQFTLHAWDDLAVEGSKTLIDIAARLQALLLPASNQPLRNKAKAPPAASSPNSASSLDFSQQQGPGSSGSWTPPSNTSDLKLPPACSLRLIQAGTNLGLHCVGFVKAATPILHGPYLQTADGSGYNLPSAMTYKFTFVHNPSYTNSFSNSAFGKIQAFGPDVFKYFYNTAHLSAASSNNYADIEDVQSTSQAVTVSKTP